MDITVYREKCEALAADMIKHGYTRKDSVEAINQILGDIYSDKDLILVTLRKMIDDINRDYQNGGTYGVQRVSFNPSSIMYPNDESYRHAIEKSDGCGVVIVKQSTVVGKKSKKDYYEYLRDRVFILVDIDRCGTDDERVAIISQINRIVHPDEHEQLNKL